MSDEQKNVDDGKRWQVDYDCNLVWEQTSKSNTMVAEDIGNSYGRCNQIADASIEIEKKIKELSEKELQDEKVIIDILRKCFKDKEDIASMAEGDNLEMLVEKVMELIREVYM